MEAETYVLLGTLIAGILLFCCAISARSKDKHENRYRTMCREKKRAEEEEERRESVLLK